MQLPLPSEREAPEAFDRERRIVLICARTVLDDQAKTALRSLLHSPIEWEEVRLFAARHHISALLFHHLSGTAADLVPPKVLADLRHYYFHLAARNLRLVGEAAILLKALEEHGAPAVLWKGPALAYSVYPSPELRTFTDLDIIVRRRDLPTVRRVMEERGYHPRRRIGMTPDQLFSRRGDVATMWHEERQMGVDVHWGSTGRYMSPVMDCEKLWRHTRSQSVGAAELRVLDPSWMLLALCAHGAKHGPFPWPALKWVSDFDAIARAHTPEEWESVVSLARRTGSYRMLLLGLQLARDLLEAPLPPAMTERLEADPTVAELAAPIKQRLLAHEPEPFEFSDRLRFDLGIRERAWDRAIYTATRALMPSERDLVAAPQSSTALLVPLRLIRLAVTYLMRPARARAFLLGSSRKQGDS